jgi:hypothetical protein
MRVSDPTLLLVLMWSGLVMLSANDAEAKSFLSVYDEKELGDECLRRVRDEGNRLLGMSKQGLDVDPDQATTLLQSAAMIRTILIGKGLQVNNEAHRLLNAVFPLAKIGLLAGDDVRARNPRDLTSWIWAEERARLQMLITISDGALADLAGELPKFLPNRGRLAYFTMGDRLPASAAVVDPSPWLDIGLPCPDLAFESLPAAPITAEDLNQWQARDQAHGGILDSIELHSIREVVSWIDLPPRSPERQRVLSYAVAGILKIGSSAFFVVFGDLWCRVVVCRDFFVEHGFKLYDPPMGASADEEKARRLRSETIVALEDLFDNLPEDVRALDSNGDGAGLRELAVRWWGKSRATRL